MDPVKAIPFKARLFIGLCAVIALGISLFLMWHGHDDHPNIPGCSEEHGCSSVTESRWAKMGPVPVSWLGVGGYMLLIAGMGGCAYCPSQRFKHVFWRILTMAALVGIGFIIWLTSIQAFIIGHFCAYCMSSHVAGSIAFLGVLRFSPIWNVTRRPLLSVGLPSGGILFTMIALHLLLLPDFMTVEAAENLALETPADYSGGNLQFGKKADSRTVTLLDGNITFDAYEIPLVGSPDAEVVVAELFDYACESCRRVYSKMHRYQKMRGNLAIASFPTPMNPDCNDAISMTHPGFQQSCEYVRYSLAVWVADASQYETYHAYLMDGRRPPKLEEAREKAESLVGSEAFAESLKDKEVERRIRDGVALYKFIGAKSLPRIIAGDQVITSSGLSKNKLFNSLNEALGIDE